MWCWMRLWYFWYNNCIQKHPNLESNEPLNWLIENGGKDVRECLKNENE